jgi:peptidoglycan hydrolase CwlO-like protein
MKYSILLLSIVLGCTSPTETKIENNETYSAIDSIIGQSKKNLVGLDSTIKRTDSTITGKVDKTVKQISTLKEENTKLKKENENLKNKLDDATDVGQPFKLLPVSNGQDNR